MVMRRIQLTDIFERLGEHRAAYLLSRPRTTARAYNRPWKQALSRHNVVCQKLAFVMAAWRKALIECREWEWHSARLLLADSRLWAVALRSGYWQVVELAHQAFSPARVRSKGGCTEAGHSSAC